jgi:hypothetical protein
MKTVILCKPFDKVKSYSMCLNDSEKLTITPLIYFKKSSFLTDAEYNKLMQKFQVQFESHYIPETVEQGEINE